jgi:hypothetical protein
MHVVDKGKFNWMGFHELLSEEIVHGVDQELQVTLFDKTKDETVHIDSDSALLHAFDVYWDSRKVPLTVHVVDTGPRLLQSQCSNANASQCSNTQSLISTQESQVNYLPLAMILSDDNVVPNPVPNPVDDHNGEAVDNPESVSHPDLAANLDGDGNFEVDANPDVAPNPEGVANLDVAPNLDHDGNPKVDGDDAEEDHPNADDD